jgi:hypothetical protein
MYPWAVPPADASAGWAMTSNGSVTNGGLCMTSKGSVEMSACSAASAASQQFSLDANGNLRLTATKSDCVALLHGFGPALTMAQCKSGTCTTHVLHPRAPTTCTTHVHTDGGAARAARFLLCLPWSSIQPCSGAFFL